MPGRELRLPVERLYQVDGTPRELAEPDVIVSELDLAAAGLEDAVLRRALQLVRNSCGSPLRSNCLLALGARQRGNYGRVVFIDTSSVARPIQNS
jgi:hypothetical protein